MKGIDQGVAINEVILKRPQTEQQLTIGGAGHGMTALSLTRSHPTRGDSSAVVIPVIHIEPCRECRCILNRLARFREGAPGAVKTWA